MMLIDFEPGDFVSNPANKEWGIGQVQSNINNLVTINFENVGKDFPQEVRNVYYNKRENKNIYGHTTQEEAEELKEEGIDIASIPWVDKIEN